MTEIPIIERSPLTRSLRFEQMDAYGNSIGFSISGALYEEQTPFQNLKILQSEEWGHLLILDGEIQSASLDEALFNEIRAHVPFYAIDPTTTDKGLRALIIGGGNGASLRELLKHPEIQHVDLVEIDPRIIAVCSEKMPEANDRGRIFKDPRVQLHFQDGMDFLKDSKRREGQYHVLLNDTTHSTKHRGLASAFHSQEFIRFASEALAPEGVFSLPLGTARPGDSFIPDMLEKIRNFFALAGLMKAHVPTFGLGFWTAAWASQKTAVHRQSWETIDQRIHQKPVSAKIYNTNAHFSSVRHDSWLAGMER